MSLSSVMALYISDVSLGEPEPANGLRTRNVLEIFYSCIVTIILCASYCIRPNLSAPNAPTSLVFMRKLCVTFAAFIFPELVIVWAYHQWDYAREFARRYTGQGWTIAHGQFVIMGGFILYDNDAPLQVLSIDTFTNLLDAGYIEFPSLTEQDIKTKSRAHPLFAAVILLQTTWFIVQCIARGARGLDITQLEMITIVLIGIHASLLLLWWHKPLDARSFVRIDAKHPLALRTSLRPERTINYIDLARRNFSRQNNFERNLEARWNLEFPVERKHSLETSLSKTMAFVVTFFTDYKQVRASQSNKIQQGALEVPIFHASNVYEDFSFKETILRFLFASPYLAMWASHFPSPVHEKVWHVASIISFAFSALFTFSCVLLCLVAEIFLGCTRLQSVLEMINALLLDPGSVSTLVVMLVLAGARLALLIEGFLCLKSSSTTARLAVAWTDFIPHIT